MTWSNIIQEVIKKTIYPNNLIATIDGLNFEVIWQWQCSGPVMFLIMWPHVPANNRYRFSLLFCVCSGVFVRISYCHDKINLLIKFIDPHFFFDGGAAWHLKQQKPENVYQDGNSSWVPSFNGEFTNIFLCGCLIFLCLCFVDSYLACW